MLEADAVRVIADLAERGQSIGGLVRDVDGHAMSTVQLHHIPPKKEPVPPVLALASLSALAEYLATNRDGHRLDTLLLHVASPTRVDLLGPIVGDASQRFTFVTASCSDLMHQFLGQSHRQEDFIVALQTRFQDTPERAALLKLVGSIKEAGTVEATDDGRSQQVAVRGGVHLSTEVEVPNPVVLTPFRTFREVEQAALPFILRVKTGPFLTLHEADGGAWQHRAMESVRAWLADHVTDIPILA